MKNKKVVIYGLGVPAKPAEISSLDLFKIPGKKDIVIQTQYLFNFL